MLLLFAPPDPLFAPCCTQKFSLSYFSRHCKNNLQVAQDCSKSWTVKSSPKAVNLKIRVSIFIKIGEPRRLHMLSMVLICSQLHPCQISSLAEKVWSVNCSRGPKIDCAREKVNCVPKTVKPQVFCQNYHFEG